ncbi:MAG: M28 family peptidase [Chitinophagaceae bacterium]
MKKTILIAPLLLGVIFAKAQKNEDAAIFANSIKGKELKEKLTIVASAEMEGRETATPGQKKAAAYIEQQFKKLGLKPANGESYQQMYAVYVDELAERKLTVNGKQFTWDKDFNFQLQFSTNTKLSVNNIVFAGYGLVDEKANLNDFAGLDIKGKVVVVIEGAPKEYKPTPNVRQGSANASLTKMNYLKSKGAAGLLVITKDFPRKIPTAIKTNMYFRKPDATPFFMGTISEEVASSLLGRTTTLAMDAFKDVIKTTYYAETNVALLKQTTELASSNVCAVLEGTDKKDEYVVLTAHYDHLGKRDTVIYYGADDDGSGTVAVIEMAEAFVAAKKKGKGPRRSIVFMTVSGEEKGLWGSEYYAENPLFPLAKTTVNLNTDMVGRTDPKYKGDTSNYVYVIGDDKISTDLTPITDSVNITAKMELDRRYNDLNDPNRFYYRSDHYNFAKKGVPIIFYFDGVHADYHKGSDTVDKINFELMEKRVRFIFNTAWAIANKNDMLKRNIPLNIPPR